MQVTAHPAGTRDDAPATTEETRPVRMLVPTIRRDEYFLPLDDTLRASDLDITRATTDTTLYTMRPLAAQMLRKAGSTENPFLYLLRIRDALRHPRDIEEAIEWGLHVPNWLPPGDIELADELGITDKTTDEELEDEDLLDEAGQLLGDDEDPLTFLLRVRDARRDAKGENEQEISDDRKKRLGWWVVYDLDRQETRQQREDRYLSDDRLVDMRGLAAAMIRQYATIKDLKFEGDNARKMIDNKAHRRKTVQNYIKAGSPLSAADIETKLLLEARDAVLKALPPRRIRAGQSDMWYMRDAFADGRERTRLTDWYEANTIKQTGRPKGSRTRNRRPKVTAS